MTASYSRILKIALPIMLSNAFAPLIGLVDAAVIGRLGAVAPLAAVGIGGTFIAMMFWVFNFFDITTTARVGHARGAGDMAPAYRHMRRSFVLAAILAFFIVLLIPLWLWLAPKLYDSSADVAPFLKQYIGIRLFATPEAFAMHILTGYLLAMERTRTLLGIEIFVQVINLVLDIAFVMGFGWGVAGVAWASVIAAYSGLMLALWILRHDLAPVFARMPRSLALDQSVKQFLQNNGYLFARALGLHMVILLFYRAGGGLSDEMVAVNTVLMIYVNFAAQATDGFAVAIEVLVAQGLGAKDYKAMRGNIRRAGAISAGLALLIIALFMIFGDQLFGLISTNDELRAIAPQFLPFVSICIGIGVLAWAIDGIFFGAGKGREMMISMLITLAGYIGLLYWLVPIWGNYGLWTAFAGSYALRALSLAIFYPSVERDARS